MKIYKNKVNPYHAKKVKNIFFYLHFCFFWKNKIFDIYIHLTRSVKGNILRRTF